MQNAIKNTAPSTYRVELADITKPLVITRNGQPYYYRECDSVELNLNLKHPGNYVFLTPFEILNKTALQINNPIKDSEIPDAERDYNFPLNWEKNIEMGHTPARTIPAHGLVQTGENWNKMPYEMRIYILLHEMAHAKYKTEWKADTLALYMFINLGYNHSQALYALTKILRPSKDNLQRVLNIYNRIKK